MRCDWCQNPILPDQDYIEIRHYIFHDPRCIHEWMDFQREIKLVNQLLVFGAEKDEES